MCNASNIQFPYHDGNVKLVLKSNYPLITSKYFNNLLCAYLLDEKNDAILTRIFIIKLNVVHPRLMFTVGNSKHQLTYKFARYIKVCVCFQTLP